MLVSRHLLIPSSRPTPFGPSELVTERFLCGQDHLPHNYTIALLYRPFQDANVNTGSATLMFAEITGIRAVGAPYPDGLPHLPAEEGPLRPVECQGRGAEPMRQLCEVGVRMSLRAA